MNWVLLLIVITNGRPKQVEVDKYKSQSDCIQAVQQLNLPQFKNPFAFSVEAECVERK